MRDDVGGTRVAGDKMLDQLLANEGAHVGVVEDVGERAAKVLLPRSGLLAVQSPFSKVFAVVSCSDSTAAMGAR